MYNEEFEDKEFEETRKREMEGRDRIHNEELMGRDWKARIFFLVIGSIAAGFAFGWVAGIAAFCLFNAISLKK